MINFWEFFTYDLGIDLGTANTLVFIKNKGIMIREPSVIARQRKQNYQGDNIGRILAVGSEAKKMIGKTPQEIEVIRPLRDGVISDFDATAAMVKYFINKIHENRGFVPKIAKPEVVIGIPSGITEVERRAVAEAVMSAGARKVSLVEEPLAAAIGAGQNVMSSKGQMIVDIGGGTTEIAVISLGGIVINRSLRVAGDEMNEAIIGFAKAKYKLDIGELTAEEVKISIGSASTLKNEKQFVVRGRSLVKGLPTSIKINSVEIREALIPVISEIVSNVAEVLDETPPELVSDIIKNEIVMAGGGSMITGIDKVLSKFVKMRVRLVSDPMTCVAKGCGKLLSDGKLLERVKI